MKDGIKSIKKIYRLILEGENFTKHLKKKMHHFLIIFISILLERLISND
jgi:hypothetical protein